MQSKQLCFLHGYGEARLTRARHAAIRVSAKARGSDVLARAPRARSKALDNSRMLAAASESQQTLNELLVDALDTQFGREKVARVIDSVQRAERGEGYELNHDPTGQSRPAFLQSAHSYIDGLDARPFHDPADFAWASVLENRWTEIRDELSRAYSSTGRVAKTGNNVWVSAVREEALSYGPDWRTLVLQDRSWDAKNAKLFPKTTKIVRDEANCPSVEVFFARQAPQTGIAAHSDGCNFIMTAHLALDVPMAPTDTPAWIEVGGERREWLNGKMLVFDTSYTHSTHNPSATKERYVLLIRFWHPQLSAVEIKALNFVFEALDDPAVLFEHRQRPKQRGPLGSFEQGESRAARRAARRARQS